MLVSLKGCNFEHTELSVHFESFSDECEIVKEAKDEAKDANLLSQESKLTSVNLQLNFVSFKIDHPCLNKDTFSIPESKFKTMNFLGNTTSWSDCDMQ